MFFFFYYSSYRRLIFVMIQFEIQAHEFCYIISCSSIYYCLLLLLFLLLWLLKYMLSILIVWPLGEHYAHFVYSHMHHDEWLLTESGGLWMRAGTSSLPLDSVALQSGRLKQSPTQGMTGRWESREGPRGSNWSVKSRISCNHSGYCFGYPVSAMEEEMMQRRWQTRRPWEHLFISPCSPIMNLIYCSYCIQTIYHHAFFYGIFLVSHRSPPWMIDWVLCQVK